MVRKLICIAMLIVVAQGAQAVFQPQVFDSVEHEQRYMRLLNELRCLVCQNQTLADSNADLAVDMRAAISKMVRDDASDVQIIKFMVDRYGDFVRYRPPLDARTALLWVGPFLLVVAALAYVVRVGRSQKKVALSDAQISDAKRILDQ